MSGYNCKFVYPLLKKHKCPECHLAMRDPVQTECGHLFCEECLQPILKQRPPICPLDNEPILRERIFPDNACRRDIVNLDVNCNFPGCNWTGKLKDLEVHAVDCDYSDVQCKMCGQHVQKKSLASHQKTACPMRPELCVHCGKDVAVQQMQAHLANVCPEVFRPCPNKCNPKLQMKLHQLEKHMSVVDGDCPLTEMKCPSSIFGCTFVSLKKNIEAHLQQYALYHAQIQAHSSSQIMKRLEEMKSVLHNQSERIVALEQRLSHTERRVDGMGQRIPGDSRDSKFTTIERELSLIKTQVELLITSRSGLMGTSASYSTDVTTTTTGAVSVTGVPSLQQYQALNSKVTELDHSLDRCLSSSLDQELRLQLLEHVTYNGILLWKINDFARRKKEAVDGVTLSIYSTPFYTSRHGYKMCARIYLNGDGIGKGTHLSFFFVIMRGPFDALLTWPFKQKVILTLINQVGKKHVTDHFLPDPQSSSFQRPGRKEINLASGCPLFMRIDHLMNGGFIKDDSIFLRIVVNIADLPRIIP